MVADLLVNIDVLALGEVDARTLDGLLTGLQGSTAYARVWDADRKVVMLIDTRRVRVVSETRLRCVSLGRNVGAGLHVELEHDDLHLHVVAAHWASRIVPNAAQRLHCGSHVQAFLRERRSAGAAHAVVLGDFNDEPFSPSLTDGLQGTRDRVAVQRNVDLLYNPFWRHLGERNPLEHGEPHVGAGTHFSRMVPSSRWTTYDQALVTSGLVVGPQWRLAESATGIVPLPRLTTPTGHLRNHFDHLPILVTLEQL